MQHKPNPHMRHVHHLTLLDKGKSPRSGMLALPGPDICLAAEFWAASVGWEALEDSAEGRDMILSLTLLKQSDPEG
jgi:hypothetical protein